MKFFLSFVSIISLLCSSLLAASSFDKTIGNVQVRGVSKTSPLQVPFILWGGDVATFKSNGGLKTQSGSEYGKLGLNLQLVPGDDVMQQVKDYLSGKSPFIRCTMRMAGIISEKLGKNPATRPAVIMQMTWSAGDHMVSRPSVMKANDLKGKKVALQEFGPHVGMLDDILKSAGLKWSDIQVVWTKDITGPNGPAEKFRKDTSIAACFVITPDMIGLTGGSASKGTGAEGTVRDAKVCISTAELSRSIADVYLCRKDFMDKHPDIVSKFVLGYLKGCEKVVELRKAFEAKGSSEYMQLLKLTQNIYGKEAIPTLEEDAHGLILDCQYVGQPGNTTFFQDKNNLQGFEKFNASALEFAIANGYIQSKIPLLPSGVDFQSAQFKQGLKSFVQADALVKRLSSQTKFDAAAVRNEIETLGVGKELDEKTLVSFTIAFAPDQINFNENQYKADFERVLELSSKYGNAALMIEGHSDPTKCLATLVRAGMSKGVITRSGSKGNYQYRLQGRPLDFNNTGNLTKLIEDGYFDGSSKYRPREIMVAAKNLSLKRSISVRNAIFAYATKRNVIIDKSQIQPVGVGILNPVIAKPKNPAEASTNRRVEFRLVKVSAEALKEDDFDF